MKILFSSLILVFASSANANSDVVVESVKQSTYLKASCPICDGGSMVTTTVVEFSMVSCVTFENTDFEIIVDKARTGLTSSRTQLTVAPQDGLMDCFGPTSRKYYSLSTEEVNEKERVVIMNPSVLKASSPIID